MKKRIIAGLLCLSLMLPLFACGKDSGTNSSQKETGKQSSVKTDSSQGNDNKSGISIASFPDQPKSALESAINAAKLDYAVEIIEYPQNEYENKIKMAFGTDAATDIVLIDGPNVASYATTGVLEPLNSYWPEDDFNDLVESSKSTATYQDKIWCAPLNEANTLLFYNKDVFDELGIVAPTKLEDTWTFDELLEVCEKVTIPGERYAIMPQMFSLANLNEGMTFTQMLWIWMAGGEVLNEDATKADGYFNSEKSKAGIKYYADLFSKGYATTEDVINAYETGKVVMWLNGPWVVGNLARDFPDFNWGATPMPKGERSASGAGSWNLSIAAESSNKEKAWEVIHAITGKEGAAIWCKETGNIPARKSVLDNDKTYSEYPYDIVNEQLQNTAIARPVTPAYPQISEALAKCFAAVAYGEDVDKAVEEATEKMEKALSEVK